MKKERTFRSYKIEITRLKNLLWKCYIVLKHNVGNVGTDGNDFFTGEEENLDFLRKGGEEELKKEVRRVFENK